MLYHRADALAAVSKYTSLKNKEIFDIKLNIAILYNAVNFHNTDLYTERKSNLVFFSGTLTKKKGVFSLMKAWNEVIIQYPDCQLVMFGKGDQLPLKKILSDQALTRVTFMGHRSRNVLLDYLKQATMAVFPSYSEAFSLAPMEAMSTACPTIYTKRSSGAEIIDQNINGILIDPDKPQEIFDAIISLLSDKDKRMLIGAKGLEKLKKDFDFGLLITNQLEVYKQISSEFRKV